MICDSSCQTDLACAGWVYHHHNSSCVYFSKLDLLYEFNGTFFGIKNCSNDLFLQLMSNVFRNLSHKKID